MRIYLGIDIGSVATKLVLLDEAAGVVAHHVVRTQADPVNALGAGLGHLLEAQPEIQSVQGVAITGSGKELAAMILGADLTKNEISAHALAAVHFVPEVRTIVEIGGQDSKLILIRDGLIEEFGMNSVCAAGTGSFLEQQAQRLGIGVEDLGKLALESENELAIAGRCTVFAESDMVYKQQLGFPRPDIVYGLCLSLAKNYLNSLSSGQRLHGPVIFQGGVAANLGMRRAFSQLLQQDVQIPTYYIHMGAIGAALFALRQEQACRQHAVTDLLRQRPLTVKSFVCTDCESRCHVVRYERDGQALGYRADSCGKYSIDATVAIRGGKSA